MRILIVDDEQPARERLSGLVQALNHEVCGEAADGHEALRLVQTLQPDLVLLDIRMPRLDGLETALHLTRLATPPAVIFTTAYDEYALAAFETRAVAYLLKPVRREHLARALLSAQTLTQAQFQQLQQHDQASTIRSHLCVKIGNRLELIPLPEVYYFQAEQKYVTVRHRGGEAVIEEPLKALEIEFGDGFVRIHRNALVAKIHLRGIEKSTDGRHLVVINEISDQLEISRRHLGEVRQLIKTL